MPKIVTPPPKPALSSLGKKLQGVKMPKAPKIPLWDGPESDSDNGGITQSLLSRFLSCRERFRLKVIEGFRTVDQFSHLLEYGNMWHVCEEALAGNGDPMLALKLYASTLLQKYPLQRQQVEHWYEICCMQFPLYVKHWSQHPDVVNRTPLMQEQVFKIPYKLPSGRVVWLRGKYDSVDLIEDDLTGIWLQENKTKGGIDEADLRRQLTNDLQSMLYLVALLETEGLGQSEGHAVSDHPPHPIRGIRYNVIRRPLSGGKGQIKQHEGKASEPCGNCEGTGRTLKLKKRCSRCDGCGRTKPVPPETREHFLERLAQYVKDAPEEWFMRWQVVVRPGDIARFRRRTLDPILEQLCDWYDWVSSKDGLKDPFYLTKSGGVSNGIHWQHPFGCENYIDTYGRSDLDSYLETGNEVGLQRVDELFPELR